MSTQGEVERAAAAAQPEAGRQVEERSWADVVNDSAFTTIGVAAPYVIDAVKAQVKRPPGKHREKD